MHEYQVNGKLRNKKILLLGSTGKMGTAIKLCCPKEVQLVEKNRKDFDADKFSSIATIIQEENPDFVINTIGHLGIDQCEKEPQKAFIVNTLFPYELAKFSDESNYTLIHFSTDAVFNDSPGTAYEESACPSPINVYGATKAAGDFLVYGAAKNYYVMRVSVLFGPTSKKEQFVEKMTHLAQGGASELSISDDIVCSPCYSMDVARQLFEILDEEREYGLYHLVNSGKATLYELIDEIFSRRGIKCRLKRASYRDFPHIGKKNLVTPMISGKQVKLRDWKNAVRDYTENFQP